MIVLQGKELTKAASAWQRVPLDVVGSLYGCFQGENGEDPRFCRDSEDWDGGLGPHNKVTLSRKQLWHQPLKYFPVSLYSTISTSVCTLDTALLSSIHHSTVPGSFMPAHCICTYRLGRGDLPIFFHLFPLPLAAIQM